MAVFAYSALDAGGNDASGYTVAPDMAAAVSGLRERGLYASDIRERRRDETLPGRIRDAASFARHLALLLEAGMHLVPSLQALRNGLSRRDEKVVVEYLVESVSQGESLADSLSRFPASFPLDLTAVVASGEETGRLPEALLRLADASETRKRRRGEMVSAIAYPAFVLLLSAAVVVLLVMFVFPRLAPLLPRSEELPLTTRILLTVGGVLHHVLPWLLGALVVTAVVLWPLRRRAVSFLEDLALKAPGLSGIIATAETARFTQTLSGLVSGGVGIVKALSMASRAVSSGTIRRRIEKASEEVSEGKPLAEALSGVPHMPGVVLAALSVGEESRSLPRTLSLVSEEMYRRLDAGFRMLVTFLTPALIIAAGIIVAWIVAAVILPVTAQAVD